MIEDLMPRVWRLFAANPALIVPLALVSILNVLAFLSIGFLCISGIFAVLRQMSLDGVETFIMALPVFAGRSFSYAVVMGMLFLFVRCVLLWIHGAGWGLMMSRAAVTGRATLTDYVEGIGAFTPRVIRAWILQRCLFAIPILALALLAASASALGLGAGVTAGLLFLGAPVVLLAEGVLMVSVWMWRPACFTDNLPVIEAFRRSRRFAGRHSGRLFLIFLSWGVFLSLVLGANAFAHLLLSLLFDSPALSPYVTGAGTAVTIILWGVAALGALYYLLFFNVLYVEERKLPSEWTPDAAGSETDASP